jgi:formate dehydrogenase iron-sulfur subunit
MRFFEVEPEGRQPRVADPQGRLHALRGPGLPEGLPVAGRDRQVRQRHRRLQAENCIGCGYCVKGCPFDVPRISEKDNKAYKCTLCSDRVGRAGAGLRQDLSDRRHRLRHQGRHGDLRQQARWRAQGARLQGTPVCTTRQGWAARTSCTCSSMPTGPTQYSGLPANPSISPLVSLWKGAAKPLAVFAMVGAVVAGFFHYMKVGPIEEKEESKDKEAA